MASEWEDGDISDVNQLSDNEVIEITSEQSDDNTADNAASDVSAESLRVEHGSQGGGEDDDSSSIGFTNATPSVQSSLPPIAPANIPGFRIRKKPGTEIKRWKLPCQCPFTIMCPHLPTGPRNPGADCRDWYAPEARDYQEQLAIESQ